MNEDVRKATEALVDVRKAYRLLYYYQKRVMDLGESIANQFGYQFFYWRSDHRAVSQANSDPKLRSLWDMLPVSSINFLYLPIGKGTDPRKKNEVMLSVRVIADSDLYETKKKGEPKAFKNPLDCDSFVDLYAWYSLRDGDGSWFYGVWQNISLPPTDEQLVRNDDVGIISLGKRYSLIELLSEEDIREKSESFKELVIKKLELDENYFSELDVE